MAEHDADQQWLSAFGTSIRRSSEHDFVVQWITGHDVLQLSNSQLFSIQFSNVYKSHWCFHGHELLVAHRMQSYTSSTRSLNRQKEKESGQRETSHAQWWTSSNHRQEVVQHCVSLSTPYRLGATVALSWDRHISKKSFQWGPRGVVTNTSGTTRGQIHSQAQR